MSRKSIKRHVLIDTPSKNDQFHGKGHERTADALALAIQTFDSEDRAIGLDGPWGSGKSTVVEIAERKLESGNREGKTHFYFFTYDIWKSQGSSFRRSFLEHFLNWAEQKFPKKNKELKEIEQKIRGKVRDIESKNQIVLDWYGAIVLLLLPIIPIYYFWAKSVIDEILEMGDGFSCVLTSSPAIVLYVFFIATFGRAFVRHRENKKQNPKSTPILALSQTLLITAKQYEGQKITQHIRETDPNDFEFQSIVREILSAIQTSKSRVVVVLDNIDRMPKEEIEEHWALVRSVFSHAVAPNKIDPSGTITAIIPYDRHLIEEKPEIDEDENSEDANISSLRSRELFSKTFDEVLVVAPPVMSNARDFFHEKVKEALPNFADDDQLFRVYLIFNKMLEKEAGTATPRQIISFINDLTGLYVLHGGSFTLATIAVFLTYRDHIEENPSRLKDIAFIEEKVRTLSGDEELNQNLAAIVFNVEPDLAIQLLLDNEIASAAIADNVDKLASLANSPGFDLRVNDVVSETVDGWIQSNDFAAVIRNFIALAENHNGESTAHVIRTLINSITKLSIIELKEGDYLPILNLVKHCRESEQLKIVRHILSCILAKVKDPKYLGHDAGVDLVGFLRHGQAALEGINDGNLLKDAMGSFNLPTEAYFVFAVASGLSHEELSLRDFARVSLHIDEDDEDFLENYAENYAGEMLRTLDEISSVKIISEDQWVSISDKLKNLLVKTQIENSGDFVDWLKLLSEVYLCTPAKRRSEIDLNSIFSDAQFYDHLHEAFAERDDVPGVECALFLASQKYLGSDLPTPMRNQPNGSKVQNRSEEFEWFNNRFEGSLILGEDEYKNLARYIIRARRVTDWLEIGKNNTENLFVSNVVKQAFLKSSVPWIQPKTLLQNYDYLKNLLGEEFIPMLERYSPYIRKENVSNLALENYPQGLLTDVSKIDSDKWNKLVDRAGELLQAIDASDWKQHLNDGSRDISLLREAIIANEFKFKTHTFRDIFVEFVLSVLAGSAQITSGNADYDPLLNGIDESYRPDLFRKIREDMSGVSASSLQTASSIFPELLGLVIQSGDRISKKEKDNVIREVLCSALEGNNELVLASFSELGSRKVREFIKQSEEPTKQKKEGAWNTFTSSCTDRAKIRSVGELLHGKIQAKTLLEMVFGAPDRYEDDDSEK